MDDQIDYRALYEAERLRRQEAERGREEAERGREEVKKQLENTSFLDFLGICHQNVFLKLQVQKNSLLVTTGGLTRVDGKLYPRYLKPWQDFDARLETSFATLERAFQDQPPLLPSPAGLNYLASKLSNKKLAGEQDLKDFECLAVEGCALDVLPCFLELAQNGIVTVPGVDVPDIVSFNNYPYGVVAAESDEAISDTEMSQRGASSSRRTSSRGRSRTRRTPSSKKPLRIKPDRPAYISALGVAKRDMDVAIERAAAEAEERDRSGPRAKRPSPERTKVFPDQWCFRHGVDGAARPLFVIEYKAAHKIDGDFLRECLEPEAAASLMEDTIRALPSNLLRGTNIAGSTDNADNADGTASEVQEGDRVAKRDIAKVLTQTYHYMVDYGLQYCYATTGHALIFLYLDPEQPSTLYYRLEEPKRTVRSASRDDLKHSAVGLVLAFVLMAMSGQYMTHQWKKRLQKTQPRWPMPYEDMGVTQSEMPSSINTPVTLSPPGTRQTTAEACGDPSKPYTNSRPDQDDEDDSNPGPFSGPSGSVTAQAPAQASSAGTSTTRATQPSGSAPTQGSRQKATKPPVWSLPVNAPLSPSLPYCTQACLLGLKMGGAKDPKCPNVALHRRDGATALPATTDDDGGKDKRHPISADEFRTLLVQQLADDMDHDCCSLERFGMYGAIGVLFKLALSAYGYCFVGKGVQRAHCKRLVKEAAVYESHLAACQGRLVPVNLGIAKLADEYWTECGAHISHMMLTSFAGESLWHHIRKANKANKADKADKACTTDDADTRVVHYYQDETQRTLRDLQQYGVDHGDVNNNNMVWNEELQRVMAIDFDHAQVGSVLLQPTPSQTPLSLSSPPPSPATAAGQRKRRQATDVHDASPQAKRARAERTEAQENGWHPDQPHAGLAAGTATRV